MEDAMRSISQDLSVISNFHFQRQPIGVKFLFDKPNGIKQLDKNIPLCEMVKEAQQSPDSFYVAPPNQSCKPAAYVWGSNRFGVFDSGQFGEAMSIFKEARVNVRLNQHVPKLDKDIVKYIAFSPLDKLSFDPDLLIILSDNTSQTEILLRAMTYTTGEVWSSMMTCVMGCAWLLAYPYLTGKVNYVTTGFGTGMKAKKLFPEGHQLISIPYNWLLIITQNLREMPWILPAWAADDVGKFVKDIHSKLGIPT
jgi:uncharacterized protein (DUF169 family)